MKVINVLLSAAAAGVASSLQFTNANFYNIKPGSPFNITWADASGPVSLTLLEGGTQAYLKVVQTLATDLTTLSYSWTPDSSLTRGIYIIQFEDSTENPVYGSQFEILAPITSTIVSTTASTTATATAAVWTYP